MFRSSLSYLSRFTDVRESKTTNRGVNQNLHNIIVSEAGNRYEILGKFSDDELHEYAAQMGRMPSGKLVQFCQNQLTKIRIGEGFQGKVKYIRKINNDGSKGQFFVVKVIKKELEIFSKEQAFHEYCAARKIPGMMLVTDTIYSRDSKKNPTIYQVMPIATGGDGDFLDDLLCMSNQLTRNERNLILRHLAYSLTNTLGCMHQQRIFHVDLKLGNLLFNLNGDIFLSDFGSALTLNASGQDIELATHVLADTHFRPTRSICCALKKKGLTEYYQRIDNWSLGLVLAHLARFSAANFVKANLHKLYLSQKSMESLDAQVARIQQVLRDLRTLLVDEEVPNEMIDLIMALLNVNPAENQYLRTKDALTDFGIKPLDMEERQTFNQIINRLVSEYRPVVFTDKTVLVATLFKAKLCNSRYIVEPSTESEDDPIECYFSQLANPDDQAQQDPTLEGEVVSSSEISLDMQHSLKC